MKQATATISPDQQQDLSIKLEALGDAVAATRETFRRRIGAEFALVGTPRAPECESISYGGAIALTGATANYTYTVICDAEAATWLASRLCDLGPEDDASGSHVADALNEVLEVAAGSWRARRRELGERYQLGLPLFMRGGGWLRFFSKGVDAVSQRLAGPEGVMLQVVLVWQSGVKPGGTPLVAPRSTAETATAADLPGKVLQEATRAVVEICEIQMGLTLEIDANPSDPRDALVDYGSSIALTTEESGGWNLAVMGSKDSCEKLTRILFALDADEEPALEDVADGIGEIANVAAGVFKASRREAGQSVQIGLPLFMEGRGCIDVFTPGLAGLSQSLNGPDGIVVHVLIIWREGRS